MANRKRTLIYMIAFLMRLVRCLPVALALVFAASIHAADVTWSQSAGSGATSRTFTYQANFTVADEGTVWRISWTFVGTKEGASGGPNQDVALQRYNASGEYLALVKRTYGEQVFDWSGSFTLPKSQQRSWYKIVGWSGGGSAMFELDHNGCIPQTISIEPAGESGFYEVSQGGTLNLEALGANTALSITPQSGVMVGSVSGSTFSLLAVDQGSWQVTIKAAKSGGYCDSNTVTITVNVGDPVYCASFLFNPPPADSVVVHGVAQKPSYRLKMIQDGQTISRNWGTLGSSVPIQAETQSSANVEVWMAVYYPYFFDLTKDVFVFDHDYRARPEDDWEWVKIGDVTPKQGPCTLGGDDPPIVLAPILVPGPPNRNPPPPPPVNPDDPNPPPTPPPDKKDPPKDTKSSGTIWKSDASGDALDKATFIEGTSKIERQLQDLNDGIKEMTAVMIGALTGPGIEGEGEGETVDDPEANAKIGDVDGILSKLPQAPQIIVPQTTSQFSAVLPLPGGEYTIAFDLANYAAPIMLLRGLLSGLVTIFAFFVYVELIKGAVSNE